MVNQHNGQETICLQLLWVGRCAAAFGTSWRFLGADAQSPNGLQCHSQMGSEEGIYP